MWFDAEKKISTTCQHREYVTHAEGMTFCILSYSAYANTDISFVFQNGMPGSGNFTSADRCKIANNHIPCNYAKEVDKYHSKAFISLFSDDGSRLLTVSQGQ